MATVQRVRLKASTPKDNNYFTSSKPNFQFVSSGCSLLDCVLGGGWVLGRMANIVGDKSTAKTALATEAITNFILQFPNGKAAYRETEAAFDREYSAAMGTPIDKIDFGPDAFDTVEDFYRDLNKFLDAQIKADRPGIYVLDSLDGLSDEAEMEADIGKGTYGMAKAKQLSIMFRKLVRKIESSKVLLLIVSQVRDNIGQTFGEKHKRAGGKSMDFYATHIVWLAHIGILKRTIKKVERPYGVTIRANCKKNKVSLAHRKCDFEFIFGYGVDDVAASVNFLKEVDRLDVIDVDKKQVKAYLDEFDDMTDAEFKKERLMVTKAAKEVWNSIENTFLPKRMKYPR